MADLHEIFGLAKRPKLILFDLDGTLVDSAPDLVWCGDEMNRRLGLPCRGLTAGRSWVGNGIERFVKRALTNDMHGEPESELFEKGLAIFKELYAENTSKRSILYDGVREGLDALSQTEIQLACVTNKAEQFTVKVVESLKLKPYFELIVSGDTTPRKKPDPLPLLFAAEQYHLDPADCLMVGDSSNDVTAARAAGFAVVCVPYGYNHGKDIRSANPDLIINSLEELVRIVE